MAKRSISWIAVPLAVFLATMSNSRAQERLRTASNPSNPTVETPSGIRTDRLSPRQLRVWAAIEAIVFAQDGFGRLSHPKLHSLWQWAETSGHVIHVQMVEPRDRWDHEAGKFMVEKFDPDGQKHIAAIRLCLPVIDRVIVRKRAPHEDGFIQYEGLRKKERYAEALGHELAHAVWVLGDARHTCLVEDLNREVDELYRRRQAAHGEVWNEQMRKHLKRIQSWIDQIERPAETAEVEVWHELLERRRGRSAVSVSLAGTRTPENACRKALSSDLGGSVIASVLSSK